MVKLKILIQAILLWLKVEKFDEKFHEVVKLAGVNNSSVTTTAVERKLCWISCWDNKSSLHSHF
jgi:hypothetical protein